MPTNTDDTRLVTILLVVVGSLVVFPTLFMGFGMMGVGPMTVGMWGGDTWGGGTVSGWMAVVGLLTRLLFLAAVVGGGYLIYKAIGSGGSDSDRALEELRLAYARGDLTDEEYERRRDTLERDAESR